MSMSSPVDCANFAHQEGWITEEQRDEVIALAAAEPATSVALLLLRKGWIGPDALRAIDAAFPVPSAHPDTFGAATIEATQVADDPAAPVGAPAGPPTPEDLALFETLELSRDGSGTRTPATGAGSRSGPATVGAPTLPTVGRPGDRAPYAQAGRPFSDPGGTQGADAETLAVASAPGYVVVDELGDGATPNDRYTRTRLHAKGGIGQVWLARDASLGRDVALKELRPDRSTSSVTWTRFVQEARITGQLEHPGIVPIYELTDRRGGETPYYTMRFIRGATLSEAIKAYREKLAAGHAGPLDRANLLDAFVSVCQAVAYAHSRGVIHRDLKGQNVVLGDFGEVMVLDWGLAKVVGRPDDAGAGSGAPPVVDDPDRGETMEGQIQGTPAYMSPEQAAGRVSEIGPATDTYALGAILYEILTGQPPFQGTTTADLLQRVIHEPPRSPRAVDPTTPAALDAVCLKALNKQPENRYGSAHELALDVKRWLADEPVSAYREPWTARLARWARRHRSAVTSAAALALLAIVGLSVTTVLVRRERDEARRQRQLARLAVDDMYSKVADDWLEDRLDPLQVEFLQKALRYYEGFTAQDGSDPAVRQERGRAYLRMGDVLRKLGRHEEAQAAYRNAMSILGKLADAAPGEPSYRRHLASALDHLARSLVARGAYAEAEPLLTRSARLGAGLAGAGAGAGAAEDDAVALASTETALGDLLRTQGRLKEGEDVLRKAVGRLEPFGADTTGHVAARQRLAVAFDTLGLLQRDAGRPTEAAASYRKAVALFEPLVAQAPTLPGPRDGLARAYNSLGLIVGDAGDDGESEETLRRQATLQQRLNEDFPDRPDYRRGLARAQLNLAIRAAHRGDRREAEALYRKSLALCERLAADFPDVEKYRRDLGRALNDLGTLLLEAGRADEAEPLFDRALTLYRKLAADAPAVPDHAHSVAGTLMNHAQLLAGTGRLERAEREFHEAAGILEPLVHSHPDNPEFLRTAAKCLGDLGDALAQSERRKDADDAYRRAAGMFEGLVARPDAGPGDRLRATTCLSNRGENLRAGKLPGAEPAFRRALELAGGLVAASPKTPDYRHALAVANTNFGEYLAGENRRREAETAYQKAIDTFELLAADAPAQPSYRSEHGYALSDLATLMIDAKRLPEARPVLERAVVAQRDALKQSPRNPGFRQLLRGHLAALAGVLVDTGDHAGAAAAAEDLVRSAAEQPGVRAEAARLLTRCVAAGRADTHASPGQRDLIAASYADRAVALIREAIDRHEPGAAKLLSAAEFEPLRSREAFKTLAQLAPAPAPAKEPAPAK